MAIAQKQGISRKAGFTLVELSIVLAVIGLIVGGIMAGVSLVRSAGLKGIVTEFERYQTAVNSFATQYRGLPGDFDRATDVWGAATNCVSWANNPVSTTTATCNGDGSYVYDSREALLFWQHLVNAEMLDGAYDAYWATPPLAGRSVPAARLRGAVWTVTNNGGNASLFPDQQSRNLLVLSGTSTATPPLLPEEAFAIDTKMDDGRPATGAVTSYPSNFYASCTSSSSGGNTTAADISAVYRLTEESPGCSLNFSF